VFAAPEFATREREKTRSRPFARRTAPKPKHGRSKWRRSLAGAAVPSDGPMPQWRLRLDGSQMPSVRNQRQYTARCDPSPAGYVDLETRRVVALAFLRNETLQATGTHNQADRGAGNHALSLGSSGRRPLGTDASGRDQEFGSRSNMDDSERPKALQISNKRAALTRLTPFSYF
jgi:hypothetical protein